MSRKSQAEFVFEDLVDFGEDFDAMYEYVRENTMDIDFTVSLQGRLEFRGVSLHVAPGTYIECENGHGRIISYGAKSEENVAIGLPYLIAQSIEDWSEDLFIAVRDE